MQRRDQSSRRETDSGPTICPENVTQVYASSPKRMTISCALRTTLALWGDTPVRASHRSTPGYALRQRQSASHGGARAAQGCKPRRTAVHVALLAAPEGGSSAAVLTSRPPGPARNIPRPAAFVGACPVASRWHQLARRPRPRSREKEQQSCRKTGTLRLARNLSACLSCPRRARRRSPGPVSHPRKFDEPGGRSDLPFLHLLVSTPW